MPTPASKWWRIDKKYNYPVDSCGKVKINITGYSVKIVI
jgi:hypothetical protein